MARMRLMVLGVATIASLLLIGCGGFGDEPTPAATSVGGTAATATEASSGGGGNIDVCALLTVADLEAATGLQWGEGVFNESLSSDQQLICDWTGTSGGFATAQVLVHPTDRFFESNRSSAEDIFGLDQAPSIRGAGDTYATGEGSIVGMKIGGRFVQVAYLTADSGNARDVTTQLAQAVADRM